MKGSVKRQWWFSWFEYVFIYTFDPQTIIDNVDYFIVSDKNTQVKVLDTRNNPQVTFLPVNVHEKFPNLVQFKVKYCSLKKITAENFKDLKKLEVLKLSSNHIDFIAEGSFNSLMELRVLDLSNNLLKNLHADWIGSCRKLQTLFLSSNQLTTLTEQHFSNNKALQTIKLNDNQLTKLDPAMFDELKRLIDVDLVGNACLDDYYANQKLNRLNGDIKELCA